MAGASKKDLRTEAKSFSASLSNVYLMKKRDPQTKNLLEKAQQLIDGLLLSEGGKPPVSAPTSRTARPGAGMGQLWVKLDEQKRENDDLKRENDDLKRQRVERVRSVEERSGSPKSPRSPKAQPAPPITTTATSEMAKLKTENESLQSQVGKLQKTVKEHQDLLSKLQDDYRRSKSALEAAQKVAKKAREDTKKTEANLATVKGECNAMKNKLSQSPPPVPATKPLISSPKPKSRSTASSSSPTSSPTPTPPSPVITSEPKGRSKNVKASTDNRHAPSPSTTVTDNRHTENINEKCRPTKIALAYTTLESQQWMDAKEALEDHDAEEEEIARFLCDILMSSYQACTTVLFSVEKVIQHLLSHPAVAVDLLTKCENTSNCKLSEDISSLVCQKLRASFDKIDTNTLIKLTKYNLSQPSSGGKLVSHWSEQPLQSYAKECASLAWQMAIQKPVMKLADRHTRYDQDKHRLWWSCKQATAHKVNYVFWPALYDYEGGNLMVKAYVHAS